MLTFLRIQDFVIVEHMDLEFASGFTVLTGETGAGKSILIDALSMLLGARGDVNMVRHGCERAEISAEFDVRGLPELADWLCENGFYNDEDDKTVCLLRRMIDSAGRSRAYVNGHLATLQQLRAVGERVVDIHGQNAHQSLVRTEGQRTLLDVFSESAGLAKEVTEAYRCWHALQQRRLLWEQNAANCKQERDLLEWQVRELAALNYSYEEWGSLQAEHGRLSNAADLLEAAQQGMEVLSESESASLAQINSVVCRLRDLLTCDASLQNVVELLESAQIQIQEAVHELGRYQQNIELDPQCLQGIENRISAIHSVARKYRVSVSELEDLLETTSERLRVLGQDDQGAALSVEEALAHDKYLSLSRALSTARANGALLLSQQVTDAMQTLAMAGGQFLVALEPLAEGHAHGMEKIEFQVSAHEGLPLRPLAKVASGGELSRISLAIQVVASRCGSVPTLIFDEVDAGIGGRVAEIVGGLLKKIGEQRQVMCITHLAQVASAGDHQWQVTKSVDQARAGKVISGATSLSREERIEEIARMLGGTQITEITRRHAAEMLATGRLLAHPS